MKVILTGMVWGKCWGGGKCGYAAEKIEADNLDNAVEQAKKMLKNGSLDSGMGFESLTGACLTAAITDTKIIGGKDYTHTEYEDVEIGELTGNEIEASMNSM